LETYKPCRLGPQLSQRIGGWKSTDRVFAVSVFIVPGVGNTTRVLEVEFGGCRGWI
jgi:hypothetical protein